ncbi:MAG: hypothetical protein ACP6IU_12390 [Candidatus Asgardarchaeia archaeon]
MPIVVWWKRFPMFGFAIFLLGLGTLIQLPIIYHSQFILIIEDFPILVLTNISAIIGVFSALILTSEGFFIYYEKRGLQTFKLLALIVPIVVTIYYLAYFVPFYIHNLLTLPDFLMPIRDTDINYQFALSLLSAVTITVLISAIINERLIERAKITRKK